MTVICINNGPLPLDFQEGYISAPQLVEGNPYTVTHIISLGIEQKEEGYILAEVSTFERFNSFKSSRFVPICEEDETERMKELRFVKEKI